MQFLESMAKLGLLRIAYELRCIKCDRSFEIYNKIEDVPLNNQMNHSDCDKPFKVSEEDVFITFSFSDSFSPLDPDKVIDINQVGIVNTSKNFTYLELLMISPEFVYERSVTEKKSELLSLLNTVKKASRTDEKGKSLEKLGEKLLASPYMKLQEQRSRTRSGEIDLIFEVLKYQGTIFIDFSNILIVECKNWSKKAGADILKKFANNMQEMGCNVGIILSKNGISGKPEEKRDSWSVIKTQWDSSSNIIIVLTLEDIENVICKGQNLYLLLKEQYFKVKKL